MRNYFIDYFQLWLPIKRDAVYDQNVKLEIKGNIFSLFFSNSIKKRMINNPKLNLEAFFHMHFHHGGLIFHLKGNFFDSADYFQNISQVFYVIEKLNKEHGDDFDFTNSTISRIDFACNIPMFLNTHSFKVKKNNNRLKEWRWYIGNQRTVNHTGLTVGNRGSRGLQLSVYDKRYSPNKYADHRFRTINYSRLEYKIGRRYLKDFLDLGTPEKLRKYEKNFPKEVISFCRRRGDLTFNDESYSTGYYSDEDFNKAVGNEVQDSNADSIKIEV